MSASTIEYSPEQRAAIDAIADWLDDPDRPELVLGGYAGTGKTTVVREVVRIARRETAVAAFTGKAAFVLRQKGVEQAVTLHSLIYSVMDVCKDCGRSPGLCADHNLYERNAARDENRPPRLCPASQAVRRFHVVDELPQQLVIVDEASMLSTRLASDLRSFSRTKLLFVGDHGQLEPVGSDAKIMHRVDLRLEHIHRQAAGNPIIQFAHAMRQGHAPGVVEVLPTGADRLRIHRGLPDNDALLGFDMVLCGYNETRVAVNRRIRQLKGYDSRTPRVGEQVICLRNNRKLGLFNGMLARVEDVSARRSWIGITTDDGRKIEAIPFDDEQFGCPRTLADADRDLALFDYGYCVTVHKSQGSEWPNVCVLEQIAPMWSSARWRYTAATRAAQRLTWCTSTGGRR